MTQIALVRFGAVPEVVRSALPEGELISRGQNVVLQTHRGLQVGEVLQLIPQPSEERPAEFVIERLASEEDLSQAALLKKQCEDEFPRWVERIRQWDLALVLIDLDRTLDRQKLILYVLSSRGPDCTKLALQAAAAGLGIVEVQPVSGAGPVSLPKEGGGCGTGGGCGCEH